MLEIVEQENTYFHHKIDRSSTGPELIGHYKFKNKGAWSSSQTCTHSFHMHWSIVIKKWICLHTYDCVVSIYPFLVHFVFILICNTCLNPLFLIFHLLSCCQEGSQHCTVSYRLTLNYKVVSSFQLFEYVVCANKLLTLKLQP